MSVAIYGCAIIRGSTVSGAGSRDFGGDLGPRPRIWQLCLDLAQLHSYLVQDKGPQPFELHIGDGTCFILRQAL